MLVWQSPSGHFCPRLYCQWPRDVKTQCNAMTLAMSLGYSTEHNIKMIWTLSTNRNDRQMMKSVFIFLLRKVLQHPLTWWKTDKLHLKYLQWCTKACHVTYKHSLKWLYSWSIHRANTPGHGDLPERGQRERHSGVDRKWRHKGERGTAPVFLWAKATVVVVRSAALTRVNE